MNSRGSWRNWFQANDGYTLLNTPTISSRFSSTQQSFSKQHAWCTMSALLPSWANRTGMAKPRKLFPTSYLDGLRGVAAFFVVIYHYGTCFTESSIKGWGLNGWHHDILLFPLIRVIHSGKFMVIMFFFISGYVLSYRSLKLARMGKTSELLDSLASSVFRRWLRLMLPVIVSCFLAFLLARLNLWHHTPKGWSRDPNGKDYIHTHPIEFPRARGSFFDQLLGDWLRDVIKITDPTRFLHNPKVPKTATASMYNIGVLWTIPVEWLGSLLVYLVILGLCRTKTWVKLSTLIFLIFKCHQKTLWAPATFLGGILLAETSFIFIRPLETFPTATNNPNQLPLIEEKFANPTSKKWSSMAYKTFFTFLFIFGLYIGSHPDKAWRITPGYRWMAPFLPTPYAQNQAESSTFFPWLGGFLVVFSLDMLPPLQSIFTTSIVQYLGDISFGLYLTHVPILYTFGTWLVPHTMWITGGWSNGYFGFWTGMGLALIVLAPVTFWVADVFSRLVDEKCVKIAKWAGEKVWRK